MAFAGDNRVANLRALHTELRATLQRLNGQAIMRTESTIRSRQVLVRKIWILIEKVYESTDDKHLKAVVNSVFDSMSVIDTIAELRGLNDGHKPQWYCQIDEN